MASIIDSFKETFSDRFSLLKIAVLSAPVYYSYQLFVSAKGDYAEFSLVAGITLFFLFGFLLGITSNVINERDAILPPLNPVKMAFLSFKGLFAVGPSILVSCLLANYICSMINIISWLDITLKIIIWIIVASIITTNFLMFTKRENILDAYDIRLLFEKAGDLIVTLIFFVAQLVVINVPTVAFIGYTLLVLFGFGPIFDFYLALALVFNIAVAGHYLGQIHYEVFCYDKSI